MKFIGTFTLVFIGALFGEFLWHMLGNEFDAKEAFLVALVFTLGFFSGRKS